MKILDKLINFIFSLVMIVLSVVIILVACGYTSVGFVNDLLNDYLWNTEYKNIVIIVAVLVFLAGLKTTIFMSDFKKKKKIPIMVSTNNGNVQIASETIETMAKAVAKSHEEVRDVNARMMNKNKGIDIYMTLLVAQDVNIRSLTNMIQEEVKATVHDTTGVVVLNIDIKVKNVVEKNNKPENRNVQKANVEEQNSIEKEVTVEETKNVVEEQEKTTEESSNAE